MKPPPKISIVTPCYNAQQFIEETAVSVLNQTAIRAGRATLEYLICDGASRDATIEIVESLRSPQITLVSERDEGMYEALAKGLSRTTGDIVAYINAGDYYHPHAFDAVIDVFEAPEISWLTGYDAIYNEAGVVVKVLSPFVYRRRLFACGAYGRFLPFVQQESTFWRRELLESVDMEKLAFFRLAGDAYLWTCFSQRADLYIAETLLGGFRKHRGQLSERTNEYRKEVEAFTRPPSFTDRLIGASDRLLWQAPARLKKFMNPDRLLSYDHDLARWR